MTTEEKADYLQRDYISDLRQIDPDAKGDWGKMNVQQMIEHMSDSLRQANGKDPKDCITPEDKIPAMQAFIASDKEFRENTPNRLLGEEPSPLRFDRVGDAIGELQQELDDFFEVFDQDKHKIITNPIFGDMGYELWVQLLYKHARHHLRQFGA